MIKKEQIHKLCETLAQNSSTLPTINERTAYNQALDDVWKNVQSAKETNEDLYVVTFKTENDCIILKVTLDEDEAHEIFNEEVKRLKETEGYKYAESYSIKETETLFCFSESFQPITEVYLRKFSI